MLSPEGWGNGGCLSQVRCAVYTSECLPEQTHTYRHKYGKYDGVRVLCPPSTPLLVPITLVPITLVPITLVPITLVPITLVPITLVPITLVPITLVPITLVPITLVPITLVPITV
ncbi:hypothetical protein STEG23_009256 [Scotinomys teguina]